MCNLSQKLSLLVMQPAQFVIAVDIIEDFLGGEKFQYLRLVSETRTRLSILCLLYARTETRSNRKDRRAWMSSIVRDPMFSFIFSPRELAGLESTCGVQTLSSFLTQISILIRYVLAFPRMLLVYSSPLRTFKYDPPTFYSVSPFSLRLGNRSGPPLPSNEAVLS